MSSQQLILKRASASRPSGKWNEDDYDMLAGDVVVGRIMKAITAPVGSPWFWTLAFGYHRDRRRRRRARLPWPPSLRAGAANSVRSSLDPSASCCGKYGRSGHLSISYPTNGAPHLFRARPNQR
jgi:hypothetical protein